MCLIRISGLILWVVMKLQKEGSQVVFGKFENLDLARNRGDEVTNQLKGNGYGVTTSIFCPTVGVNIPVDSLGKEGNPYAKEFGWTLGGSVVDGARTDSRVVVGKGGWIDPSDKQRYS